MKRNAILAVLGTAAALLLGGCNSIDDSDIDPISIGKVRDLLRASEREPARVVLIDPRAQSDYQEAHLPGAKHAVITDLRTDRSVGRDRRIASYDNIIVYGANPASAAARAMTKRLMVLDYKDVYLYFGGMEEWTRAGLPIERGPDPEPWFARERETLPPRLRRR
ncbi:MAG: rhodanese-like domain-containing protein [Planctomycetota bacterium]